MKNVNVLARVRELQAEQAKRLCITSDWVLMKLVEVTQKAMQEKAVMEFDYDEKCLKPTGEYIFDSKGANRALELIGKHLGMYTDKLDLNVPVTVVIEDDYAD